MSVKSDVCLVLEGTYPYIAGGVSEWVHQLISSLKDIRFSLLCIWPTPENVQQLKYKLPTNIVSMEEVFVQDEFLPKWKTYGDKRKGFDVVQTFLEDVVNNNSITHFKQLYAQIGDAKTRSINPYDLSYSKHMWDIIEKLYVDSKAEVSFVDFFWTYRFLLTPFVNLLKADIPNSSIYHAVSTGYAGLLGSMAHLKYNRPFIITEHGLYTRERKIEITQAEWIYEKNDVSSRPKRDISFIRKIWINMFKTMSKISYNYASDIITLFEGNQMYQVLDGALSEKLTIIPNGIDIKIYSKYQRDNGFIEEKKKTIAFIGRVVAIKDVKTFIKACKIVLDVIEDAQVFIFGPVDEEPEYYEECKALINLMQLDEKILFKGKVNAKEYYPDIDVVVLTSISESQPLVILEANASGVPVVASDVGSCRELLEGRIMEDKQIGKSGLVTSISSSKETANAILEILKNEEMHKAMALSGRERIRSFYDRDNLFSNYLRLYEKYIY